MVKSAEMIDCPMSMLPQLVEGALPPAGAKVGSINWYTMTVKLDLAVQGDIHRVSGTNPQRLLRS